MPRNTKERMVDLLMGLAYRLDKLDALQGAADQPIEKDSSVLGSAIGLGKPINTRALGVTPPRDRSPHMSPGTYFG